MTRSIKYEFETKKINIQLFKRLERHLKQYGVTLGDVFEEFVYNATMKPRGTDERYYADIVLSMAVHERSPLDVKEEDYTPFSQDEADELEREWVFTPSYCEWLKHRQADDLPNFDELNIRQLKAKGFITRSVHPPFVDVNNHCAWYKVLKPFTCDGRFLEEGAQFQPCSYNGKKIISSVYTRA